MKPAMVLQIRSKRDLETLEVFRDGRIICSCLHNLYHKERETNSVCWHARQLREDIIKGDLTKYLWII